LEPLVHVTNMVLVRDGGDLRGGNIMELGTDFYRLAHGRLGQDVDRSLVDKRRGDHNRLGFAVQLTTVRFRGAFLPDLLDVPTVVLDFVAEQVRVVDASVVKGYLERRSTRFEYQAEIAAAYGYREFIDVRQELAGSIEKQAWLSGTSRRRCSTPRCCGCVVAALAQVLLPGHDQPGAAGRAGPRRRAATTVGHVEGLGSRPSRPVRWRIAGGT
jgi:hypothetical protein